MSYKDSKKIALLQDVRLQTISTSLGEYQRQYGNVVGVVLLTHPTSQEGEAILRDLLAETRHLPSHMWHTHIHTCTGYQFTSVSNPYTCIAALLTQHFQSPVSYSGLWRQRAPYQPRRSQDSPCLTPLLGSDFFYYPVAYG